MNGIPRKDAIVFLWAEVTGYLESTIRVLSDFVERVDVVHWDKRDVNSTRYKFAETKNVRFHARSQTSESAVYELLMKRQPTIIVVSGWMDKGYLRACNRYRSYNPSVRVVAGIDDQWVGSFRQRIGQLYYRLFYRRLFDFMWVCGAPQFSFAQRFGYGIDNTIFSLYSADTTLFSGACSPVNRRLVYVGRLVDVKAPVLLAQAYSKLPATVQSLWPLVFIGHGDQRERIAAMGNPNITLLPFLQPQDLHAELRCGGVACLPSHKDQWGVAVHEYALLGLPLILSSGVGASTEFLISGFNGLMFQRGSVDSLLSALERITSLSDPELEIMGRNSSILGRRVTSEMSARALLSVTALVK